MGEHQNQIDNRGPRYGGNYAFSEQLSRQQTIQERENLARSFMIKLPRGD